MPQFKLYDYWLEGQKFFVKMNLWQHGPSKITYEFAVGKI
jgi:hypothetical protein